MRGLSRELWLIEAGVFLNMLGYGAVFPFEVIYLHEGRGFPLGVAGLVVGTLSLVAVVVAPFAGVLIDRFGARVTAAGAGLALAAGYAGLALAHAPAPAFAAAALGGIGNGALNPSQSTLVAALAPRELRHRASAVSRVAGNAGAGLGGALGGAVAAYGLNGFVALYLGNAVTYLLYVAILVAVVRGAARPEPIAGGYRVVARDGAFLRLAGINVAMIAVGWGVLAWLVPSYATDELGYSTRLVGLLLLANATTVVVAQVPVARLAEGRRRVVMLAASSSLFVLACLLVLTARPLGLVLAAITFGLGECFHGAALFPLVAELAPPALRGRYMAAIGLSWWLGLAVAPTLGTQVPATAALLAGCAVAAAAAVSALTLDRRLPAGARATPRPHISRGERV